MKNRNFAVLAGLALLSAVYSPAQTAITGRRSAGYPISATIARTAAKTEHFYVHDLGGVKRADPENSAGVRYHFSAIQFVEVLPLPAGKTSINRLDQWPSTPPMPRSAEVSRGSWHHRAGERRESERRQPMV